MGSCARRGISASAGACLQLATECILIFLNSAKKNSPSGNSGQCSGACSAAEVQTEAPWGCLMGKRY